MTRARGAALAVTLLLLAAPAWVYAGAVIRVGIYANPPLIFRETGGPPQGIYVDILQHVARQEDWTLEYVDGTWEQCLTRLEQGRIDLLVAIGYSAERSRRFDFSHEPVIVNWGQVYIPPKSGIRTLLDLTDHTLAVVRGDIYYESLKSTHETLKVFPRFVEVDGYAETMRLVSEGQADAALVPRIFGAYHNRAGKLEKTSIMFSPVELRFAAPKGRQAETLATLDRYLVAMKADKRSLYNSSLVVWLEGVRTLVFPKWLNPVWVVTGVAVIGALIMGMNLLLRRQVRLRTRALRASLAAQAKIASELRIARDIQMSFIPRTYPPLAGWEIYGELRPAREVGGDFYDCFLLEDGRLYFVLGDVSDKGVPAALFMAVTKTLLGVSAGAGDSPAAILERVNQRTSRGNDECMFATAFCGILEPESGRLAYTNAGHNPPFALRASGEVEGLAYACAPALGIADEASYTIYDLTLKPGDALFMYTDGVTEAMDRGGAFFSEGRLRTALARGAPAGARDLAASVIAQVAAFTGDIPPADDIAVLVIRRAA